MRPSWDQYAINIAHVAASRSEDIRKVGACALDHNNRVIGVAYNGLAAGKVVGVEFWEDRDTRRPYMIHAESNLLSLFKRGEAMLVACTLLPCSCCATNIAAHGIKRVVYSETYDRDMGALEIFRFYNIETQLIKKT